MAVGSPFVRQSADHQGELSEEKGILPHFLQGACSRECVLVSVLVAVLVISVYGWVVGRNLFESGQARFSFSASRKFLDVFLGKTIAHRPK